MSQRGFSLKRLALLLAVFMVLPIAVLAGVFWSELQYGLKFPGRVGTSADQYFFDGSKTEDFRYLTFTLGNGGQWKVVEADTENAESIPSWLILMVQGPARQTYILEERYAVDRAEDLMICFFTLALTDEHLVVARQTAGETIDPGSAYLDLINAHDDEALTAALLELGFRRTSF
ncbi:hypothetical protein [Cerasicoccus frondis]|uniref:hypothetical protein n=1 Tax=Cerasicoccus frondis TaxID=490090 RepID=UPI0028525AEF|nr:hypothetical protein [Cerasicoccus frondis]